MKLLCFAVLFCITGVYDVHGVVTLSASTASACASTSTNIPTGAGVTVTLTCSGTTTDVATIATAVGSGGSPVPATIVFKQGATDIFTLTATATGDGTGITSDVPSTYPQNTVTSSIPASDAKTLQVVVTDAPAAIATADWTCAVTADNAGTPVVTADAASAALDLTAYCVTGFTTTKATCDTNLPKLTCTTGALQLDAWEADPTAVLNFRVGGTAKFSLSASNIAASTTSGNLDSSAGTWSAASAAATAVTAAPSTMDTADQTADWTCDITGATGSFNGGSAALALTVCPAYTLSATCSGTTVSALSLTTPGLTFTTFVTDSTYTITVFKGTEDRYKLTSGTISNAALNGDLDAASGTIVAGTYTVASASATTWTFTPTVAITEADEGSDWRMVVSAAAATNGGTGDVSITCGAQMNTVAGLLIALLVASKVLLF